MSHFVIVIFFNIFLSTINTHPMNNNIFRRNSGKFERAAQVTNQRIGVPKLVQGIARSKTSLYLILCMLAVLVLAALGFIKGALGLLAHGIGMYGLDMLIDIPRPLCHYYELGLRKESVVYDDGGWPVHPESGKRTVWVIPRRTMLCLNLVFFLAFPFALLIYLFGYICGIRNYPALDEDDNLFKHVDKIKYGTKVEKTPSKSVCELKRVDMDDDVDPWSVSKQ